MAEKTPSKAAAKPADAREDRLKAALRANLARRKAQSRARSGKPGQQAGTPGTTGQEKDA
ncbi:hypothetical protein [uncultured Roseobacter sp.]|uniref:hypothetical protein n=1 Tax=uncultured Roseobacter sp. TaxID=114847 RepID=UPI00262DCF16|nr:hypothetical protein [uncultured Roseobacter sp.]